MTTKVGPFVRFINNFSSAGRKVNKMVSTAELKPGEEFYQRRMPKGSIALLKNGVRKALSEDTLFIFKRDGSECIKKAFSLNDIISGIQRRFSVERNDYSAFGQNLYTRQLQKTFNLTSGRLEEIALRTVSLDDGVKIKVISKKVRQSVFPSTAVGSNLHPAVFKKDVLPNGDTLFTESYLKP